MPIAWPNLAWAFSEVISLINMYSKLSFSYAYKSISSNSAKDFLIKTKQAVPFITEKIQVQNYNGNKFMKNFQNKLIKKISLISGIMQNQRKMNTLSPVGFCFQFSNYSVILK